MKYRTFGKTGWQVSEIGFGAWGIGGGWGPVDDRESIATLLSAWENGINFVDTAQMYGSGHSEEVIGEALRSWNGGHVYIATKVQPVAWPHPSETDPEMDGRYPAAYLREQCEASLRRLGVEAIDLYQLHGWFPRGAEQTEWHDTLEALRREGKIREIGVSIRDYKPAEGVEVVRRGLTGSVQVVYNLFEQRPAETLFPACREHGAAVIARVPFDEGSLIGSWDADSYARLAPDDFRRNYFKGGRFARTLANVEALKRTVKELTGDRYGSLAEVALRFCLSDPAVGCVIPGMKNAFELGANIAVSDGEPLPAELTEALRAYNWPRNYHNPDEEKELG